MKKIKCALLVLIALFGISGCVSYKAVGKFDNNEEFWIGNVNHNLMMGGGKYEFTGVSSNVNCSGIAASPDKIPLSLNCAGQEGNANGTCSNGKTLTMRWYAKTCTTGYGNGATSSGDKFTFTFGLTKEEAMEALNSMLEQNENAKNNAKMVKINEASEKCKKLGLVDKTEEFKKCVLDNSN